MWANELSFLNNSLCNKRVTKQEQSKLYLDFILNGTRKAIMK